MLPQRKDQPYDSPRADSPEYSDEERKILLKLAHDSIAARLRGEKPDITPPTPHLAERRGAFTTLHIDGQLRGCIGYVFPVATLYQTVADTAASAAFEDPRFYPVEERELPFLSIEISVLSPLQPIAPDHVVIGKHGLVVNFHGRRGLLLPQVPVELGWDRETFLEQTCLKANVPPDAWRRGATLEAFTAEVFGEE
jgi:AmmeMemoRadiSam system protein A